MLSPGAIVDPEDLRIPGEQPGSPMVILDDLGPIPHGHRFRARQGKSLVLLAVLAPEVVMQRELRDLLAHQTLLAGEIDHPNLLPTYGFVRLPLGEDGFDTLFLVRPDPGCPTLRQWLHEVWQAGHALDALNAVAIAVQVCEALAALHDKFAHGYVTADNVYMYPTGGMPQALLAATGEGPLLPFAPDFERFVQAGYLPMAGRELFESPHLPRVETDVLGVAGLVLEILTGQPLEPGMALDRFKLPPRLVRVLSVASRPDPDERPQDILMFSRRLQAAVGLGDDPVEPSAVLEPVHHGDHADPRYPAVRAKPWRPPTPPPPPWAPDSGPTPSSGAWNVGTPTPGSGAWKVGTPTPASGAWNVGPAPSSAWSPPTPPGPPESRHSNPGAPAITAPPAFGRDFPIPNPPPPLPAPRQTQSAAAGLPPPPSVTPMAHSVSIMMPAPDGSVMASLSRGPANFVIVRRDKRHGPYDLGQLERLIPMGKLRSVDAIELLSEKMQILAVDLPGLRPLFETRARAEEQSIMRSLPTPPLAAVPVATGRNKLWAVIGFLAFGLIAAAAFLASRGS